MAIERTDYNHAAGVFNVNVPGNVLVPIAQDGFRAWVRDGVGRYRLQCVEHIAYVESIVEVFPGLNAGAGSIAGQVTTPGIVIVNAYDGDNNPIDVAQFRIEIRQVATQAGPAGVEPPAPTPGGGGGPGAQNVTTLTTTADYYVDASAGSDTNDGLTPLTAWQTFARVQEAIGLRILRASVRVHVAPINAYELPSIFGAYGYEGGALTIQVDTYNIVASGVATGGGFSPYSIATALFGNFRGFFVRMTSGAAIGQIRLIQDSYFGGLEISGELAGLAPGDTFDVVAPSTSVLAAPTGTTLRGAPMTQGAQLAYAPSLNFFNVEFGGPFAGDRTMRVEGRVALYACTQDGVSNTLWQPSDEGAVLLGMDAGSESAGAAANFSTLIGFNVYSAGLGCKRNFTPVGTQTGNVRGWINVWSDQLLAPPADACTVLAFGLSQLFGGKVRGGQTSVRVKNTGTRCIFAVGNISPIGNQLVINNTDPVGAPDTAGIVVVENGAQLDAYSGDVIGVAPGAARAAITCENGALVTINQSNPPLAGSGQTYGLWARFGGRIDQNVAAPAFIGLTANLAAGGAAAPVTAASLAALGNILIPLAASNDGSVIQRTVI